MANAWIPAPECRTIGTELILAHHPHLIDERVDWAFNEEAEKVKGRVALATARKVTGLAAYYGAEELPKDEFVQPPDYFLISVWKKGWDKLSHLQRKALIDHELCHCRIVHTDNGEQLKIVGHDVEEFHQVVERYGSWMPAVEAFVKAAQSGQQNLFGCGTEIHLEVAP